MGETLPLFSTTFNRSLSVEARPEHLTGDAGAVLLREILERSGMVGWLIERLSDPRQSHLVTYTLADLLRTVLILFGQGWRDQDDADALRYILAHEIPNQYRGGPVVCLGRSEEGLFQVCIDAAGEVCLFHSASS